MEFVKYYPDERVLGSTDKPFEFGLGKESGGEITEAWFARNEAGIMSVFYREDRKMVDIMFSSLTEGYRHVQASRVLYGDEIDKGFKAIGKGYTLIFNEGIFKGREDTGDMSILLKPPIREFGVGKELPLHVQELFELVYVLIDNGSQI